MNSIQNRCDENSFTGLRIYGI